MSVDISDYHMFVMRLAKPGAEIQASTTANDLHIMHMLLGLSGEVGELIDGLKKQIIYGKELDRANIVEEFGDIEFYLQGLRCALLISRDETVSGNMVKLKARYKAGWYSNAAAQSREDKKEA